jgi:ankyrin repeat protein
MYKTLLKSIGANNDTLHEVAKKDDIKRIRELSTYKGFNVDVLRRHDQKTALYIVADKGNFNAAKELINLGAIVNWKYFDDTTALHLAAQKNHPDIVKLLIKNGANPNLKTDGVTALIDSTIRGYVEVVTELLKSKDIDINDIDSRGNTALMYATAHHNLEVVHILADYDGIKLRQTNKEEPIVSAVDIAENLNHQDILDIFDRVKRRNQRNRNLKYRRHTKTPMTSGYTKKRRSRRRQKKKVPK